MKTYLVELTAVEIDALREALDTATDSHREWICTLAEPRRHFNSPGSGDAAALDAKLAGAVEKPAGGAA